MHSVAWHCKYPATWKRERLVQPPLLLHFSSPCQIVGSCSSPVQVPVSSPYSLCAVGHCHSYILSGLMAHCTCHRLWTRVSHCVMAQKISTDSTVLERTCLQSASLKSVARPLGRAAISFCCAHCVSLHLSPANLLLVPPQWGSLQSLSQFPFFDDYAQVSVCACIWPCSPPRQPLTGPQVWRPIVFACAHSSCVDLRLPSAHFFLLHSTGHGALQPQCQLTPTVLVCTCLWPASPFAKQLQLEASSYSLAEYPSKLARVGFTQPLDKGPEQTFGTSKLSLPTTSSGGCPDSRTSRSWPLPLE